VWKRVLGVVLVLAVVGGSVAWWRSRPPAFHAPASVAALAGEIDATVPGSLREHHVPGASVAIVHDGKVRWAGAYGTADDGMPMRPDTVMQIASVSKSVAAYTLLRLGLDLDAPVERYTGAWRLPPSRFDSRQVTLRRLLSHTAGINVDGYPGRAPGVPLPSTKDALKGVRIVDEPGRRWRYSGGGYTIAQFAAETATGKPFAQLVKEQVLTPLHMDHSGYACDQTARGHDRTGAPMPNYCFAEQAAGGLCATASDLGRFAAVAMDERVMTTPAPATDGAYGLGLHIGPIRGDDRRFWHNGSNRGWQSRMELFPDAGWGLVVLTNGDNGADVIADVTRLIVR